ncbi:hypothetical protein H8S90_01030 [Olivibacter sp. SDN3]|uniref:CD-NTase-associated protein 16 NUDIX domain-containing protein n=1 Tax=Olivibacter jilunii TaxID=985016 RepID=A0ABW6AXR9_9SPHI|nr:hypothetical protein [Olivibacter sp. SDN3]MDX3917221.1 hypothetical protein [Pseudosphingobacterium sp.]QNL50247.1 hypothetical protein H8S90_01030 [Olivibacter sp. SDN3]
MKGKVSFIIGILGFAICFFLESGESKATIFKISLGFVLGSLIEFIVFLVENRRRWGMLKTFIIKPNKPVRITVAYLFRIEINGKYILIKRHKKDRIGYQPIGGAFKYFKEENRELFDKLGIEPCDLVPRDEDTEHDLRIRINKRKKLIEFLKWFESRKNREIDPWREFYEELIEPGLLPSEPFKHVKYAFIGNHKEGVIPSPVFPIDEFRYAEIYELRLETDAQKKAIANLLNNEGEIIFASPDEIRRGATEKGEIILPHTFKILPR